MTEADFIRDYDPAAYERPSVTVDLVLLGLRQGRPAALLTHRAEHPYAGCWALPGGFVGIDESLDSAATRVLREKAGLEGTHLEQLYTFGAVARDPPHPYHHRRLSGADDRGGVRRGAIGHADADPRDDPGAVGG
jgi:8-oxo-dGTP diphosphatase